MSTKPKAISAYLDCIQIMDRARAARGARLPFEDRGKAVSFRQRCYRVRGLLQQRDGDSAFDSLYIQIDPLKGPKGSPAELVFLLRAASSSMLSAMRDLDGKPIKESKQEVEDDDKMLEEARAMAKRLGLET